MDDYWQLTLAWADATIEKYKGFGPQDLTQVFMRGPFAGLSEKEVYILAQSMRDKQDKYPLHSIN